jgi:signal transduction histidine kinase
MVGGTFWVDSAPRHGANVRVEIPFAQVRKQGLKQSKKTLNCP